MDAKANKERDDLSSGYIPPPDYHNTPEKEEAGRDTLPNVRSVLQLQATLEQQPTPTTQEAPNTQQQDSQTSEERQVSHGNDLLRLRLDIQKNHRRLDVLTLKIQLEKLNTALSFYNYRKEAKQAKKNKKKYRPNIGTKPKTGRKKHRIKSYQRSRPNNN
jgi:hypothetical protein